MRRILVLTVLALAAVAPAISSASAQAGWHQFHAHMSAYTKENNCGVSHWSSENGFCRGNAVNGNAGTADGFNGADTVLWCLKESTGCFNRTDVKNLAMPAGYDRWMRFCFLEDCRNWILGAVKMPDGPFAVVAGKIDGNAVSPSSTDQGKVAEQGGPLYLYVGYNGSINNGGGVPSSYGYVFGFRGWLHW